MISTETRRVSVRYNVSLLQSYTEEKKIELLQDYSPNINRNTIINSKCITYACGNLVSKCFRQLMLTGSYCKDCTDINRLQKIKSTNMKTFGFEHALQNPCSKEKYKNTCMSKFGVKNPSQNLCIRQKQKATCLKKSGYEHPMQNEYTKQKSKVTFLKNFGVENPLRNTDIREKAKATCMKNLGYEYPMQCETVKLKSKLTSMINFGVEYPMQNAEISDKCSRNAYKAYDYTFASGRIERIQGYEKFAIDYLIAQGINEDDIITKRTEVPECFYNDCDKKRRYYVDILIKSQRKCIEVKSTWTMQKKKDTALRKQKALQNLGYTCEIWIFDSKGCRINII